MSTYIKGAGMSNFDVSTENSHERIYECVDEALEHSEIGIQDVEAIFVSNSETDSNGERQKHIGPLLSSMFQIKIPIITVPAGCCGGGAALWDAIGYQRKNSSKNILVIGFEKLVANISEKTTDEMLMGGQRVHE